MKTDKMEQKAIFSRLELEGTSYEVGRKLGIFVRSVKDFKSRFRSNSMIADDQTKIHVNNAMEFFDKYCPGINDEIAGLSEGLEIGLEELIYYFASYKSKGCCSQMVVLPKITRDGHVYLARNYDYWPQESDLCLVTTRVKGKYNHIGFSELGFGRNDGINEHGLCISMSNAAPGLTSGSFGVEFWVIIRTVLDSCRNVNEAIEFINRIPTSTYANFIVADKNGNAALVEVGESEKSIQKISMDNSKQYLCATNHFSSKAMLKHDNARYWDSVARYMAMDLRINDGIPNVDNNLLKEIQSELMPLGTCTHHYSSRFGTLWSAIYDVTDISLEACFGSPRANEWHRFDLESSLYKTEYLASLPNINKKPAWKKLPPGNIDCSDYQLV